MYAATIEGRRLYFTVSGKLWNRSLVMADTETGTLWSHFLGRAMEGKLKDTELQVFPSVLADWKTWRRDQPTTTVMSLPRSSQEYLVEFQQQPGRFVLGIKIEGQSRAYPFDLLKSKRLIHDELEGVPLLVTFDVDSTAGRIFDRRIEDTVLTFRASTADKLTDDQSSSVWNTVTGECVAGKFKGRQLKEQTAIVSYDAVWFGFYPSSGRYAAP